MPELAFFVGKGGVGKTTVAAAYAVHTARKNPRSRVLLVSTDPAHSLADVLQLKLGKSPKAVRVLGGKLWAWELDAARLFGDFFRHYKQSLLDIVERGSLFSAAEISPLLETALPGMSEISALLAIRDAINSNKYSHIVVDTAPFGHTLRLFSMPEQFIRVLKFLELAAGRDRVLAAHFGGGVKATEPKVIAATGGATAGVIVTSFLLYLLSGLIYHGGVIPQVVEMFVGLVITSSLTFAGGFYARHVQRP